MASIEGIARPRIKTPRRGLLRRKEAIRGRLAVSAWREDGSIFETVLARPGRD